MDAQSPRRHDYLRRLPDAAYQGRTFVHWILTVDGRRKGWLSDVAHAQWREILLHACVRHTVAAPLYCMMPDHVHLLVAGFRFASDQRVAIRFLRRYSACIFGMPTVPGEVSGDTGAPRWQKQAYDRVLRTDECGGKGFRDLVGYISENPVRAGLVEHAHRWGFTGSVIPGWPTLKWSDDGFWERWWGVYGGAVEGDTPEIGIVTNSATGE